MSGTEDAVAGARDAIEALIWAHTEWRGSAAAVDKILHAVDEYARLKGGQSTAPPSPPCGIKLDNGGEDERPLTVIDPAIGGKTCRACNSHKSLADFTRDKNRSDGYLSRCKRCVKEGKTIPR